MRYSRLAMRITAIGVAAATATASLMALHTWGCGSDSTTTHTEPLRRSHKGEACQVTGDCVDGLACQPIPGGAGGVCVVGAFHVALTARECVLSECSVAADCCPS